MIVVGMQSGTSMDAIDVAVADLSWLGQKIHLRPLSSHEVPWPPELRARMLAVLPPASAGVAEICELDTLLGQHFAAAAAAHCEGADLIVSHGQTVFHWVSDGRALGTLQLGQPAWIAEATGLPVVSDLRSRDIAAGGQGAPLASVLDVLWLGDLGAPQAALNLGGIANMTIVSRFRTALAFDTGPGNCLLDIAAARVTGGALTSDVDGRLAAAGQVRHEVLAPLLAHPYFAERAPKSTGREMFHAGLLDSLPACSGPDLLATLTELTARTIGQACYVNGVSRVIVSGGGVRNPTLMAALRRHVVDGLLLTSDELGLPSDAKEAYLFALLGFLTWHGVPGVVAGVTGSAAPRVLGRITPGNAPLALPYPARPPDGLVVLPA